MTSEVENELINSGHTNILLLRQLFSQAEKWHLNLDTDTSELENRDLLEAVKKWEEREFSGAKIDTALKEKKKLVKFLKVLGLKVVHFQKVVLQQLT